MRPLRLRVNGLTCFRDEVDLDLSELSLVAIAGPTGAGKSSLLDAMILALYGFVPRMGAKNLGELVAHGRNALHVVFDFRIEDKVWRIARNVYRGKRSNQAVLAQVVDDGGVPKENRVANGVKEVEQHLKGILGIDGEAFTQAVILPQGRFQDFLKATPGDRRKILIELLGLRVYDLMRVKATELASAVSAEIGILEAQLGDAATLDEGAIAALEAERDEAVSARDEAQRQLREVREALTEASAVLALISRKSKHLAERERLVSKTIEIESKRSRLARLRSVLPLVPSLEECERLKVRLAQADRQLEASASAVDTARREADGAKNALEDAVAAAAVVVTLRARMTLLDAVKGQVEELERTQGQHLAAVREQADAERALAQLVGDEDVASQEVLRAQAEYGEARAHFERMGSPREALDEATARRDRVLALGHALREVAGKRTEVATAEQQLAESEETLGVAEVERRRREVAELQADEASTAAETRLEGARREAMAASLRLHLHEGEACPVCLQTVAEVPSGSDPAREVIEALAREVEQRRKVQQKEKAGAERARRAEEAERARHETYRRAAEAARSELARRIEAVADEAMEVLGLDAAAARESARVDAACAKFEARLAELSAAEASWQEARAEVARTERQVQAAAAARERAAQAVAHRRERLQDLVLRVSELAARADALREKLTGVDTDPKAEKARLERSIAALEGARDKARLDAQQAESALAAREATLTAHLQMKDQLAVELGRREAELVVALAERELTMDAALELADAAASEVTSTLSREVDGWERELERVERDLAEVDRELGGRATTPEEIARLEARIASAQVSWEQNVEALAGLSAKLERMRSQLERARGVKARLVIAREEQRVYRRLADDLKSNQFQDYVLEEVNADLAAGAAERLLELSGGRYRLVAGVSGYEVMDLEFAGERRSTDTLSGGETFLASLALALELSEQIQRKSGKVHLDCIFIDEGFGTLDAETLETVTEAVEALGATGRLVGLITHVTDLAARMPERIQVEKGPDGSKVKLVVG